MPLTPGMRLGPYEILSALGAGGMGEVWKARDTRLNRVVAIKASLNPFSPQSHPDGQRVVAEVPVDQRSARSSVSVVLNWPALLKQ